MNSIWNKPNIVQSHRLKYTIDTLTDGSDYTGNGTIFLTVSRLPTAGNTNENEENDLDNENVNDRDIHSITREQETILARYSLTGLSSLTSRLASDQGFNLSSLRAVLLPSHTDVQCTTGIPSILLSLREYSLSGSLCVIGGDGVDAYIEKIVDLTLGGMGAFADTATRLKVYSCVVPSVSSCNKNDKASDETTWWKVFEDEFIIVRARHIKYVDESVEYESEGSSDIRSDNKNIDERVNDNDNDSDSGSGSDSGSDSDSDSGSG